MARELSLRQAWGFGIAALALPLLLQAFNSAACYRHTVADFLAALGIFVLPPLLPVLLALWVRRPLQAFVGALCFAPWLVYAYVVDCLLPYRGGGASMIYVAVLLYGLPSCLIGVLLSGPLLRRLGIRSAAAHPRP